jgi:hypothetical protein
MNTADLVDTPKLDDTTAKWPVPDNMQTELVQLMGTYMAQPLPVFKDNAYVPPIGVNSALKDSLVEVHFSIKHYRIHKKDSKPIDSFTGLVEQIVVLKSGEPRLPNSYKRKNLLEGPYRPKPFRPVPPSLTTDITHFTTNANVRAPADISSFNTTTEPTAIRPAVPQTSKVIEAPMPFAIAPMPKIIMAAPSGIGSNSDAGQSTRVSAPTTAATSMAVVMTPSNPAVKSVPSIETTADMPTMIQAPVEKATNKSNSGNAPRKASTARKKRA